MTKESKGAAKAKLINDAKKEGKAISEKTAEKLVRKTDGKSRKAFGGKQAPPFEGPGVIKHILSCIEKGGMTREDIQASLNKTFPDREPERTYRTLLCQIGGKTRPLRMEREKGMEFKIDGDGHYSIAKTKKSK
jgi:hypothetical protein